MISGGETAWVPLGVYDHPSTDEGITSVPLGDVDGAAWWDLPAWEVRAMRRLTELRDDIDRRIANLLGAAGG